MKRILKLESKKHNGLVYIIEPRRLSKIVTDNEGNYYGSYHLGKDDTEIFSNCEKSWSL